MKPFHIRKFNILHSHHTSFDIREFGILNWPAMLHSALQFILECDKLKAIERRSRPVGMARRENSAEHSWSLALMAMTLAPAVDPTLDLLRIMKMLVLHDIVEIDAGDTFCYADQTGKAEREQAAADRIFGMLPAERAAEFMALWQEFEATTTPEASFANALDRMMPIIQNHANQGASWQENDVRAEQVLARAEFVRAPYPALMAHIEAVVASAREAAWLK
jgi:putative hydrolases of HD superfamily